MTQEQREKLIDLVAGLLEKIDRYEPEVGMGKLKETLRMEATELIDEILEA